ncbi:ABC transporter ATP-binding protein [Phreatobacter stygius]|uniref:ABC transporter ATP-binding protein n=1 Tax=Phreatobacter stygius TaxID=1940610 RepID=A0A4D7BE93_9HYPH|nr:ABC transporter ATP-binding protein [Phreatobacter stygius]QCI66302.1 ABC transporter ATP-binding protein [Phreatobacter stygius]
MTAAAKRIILSAEALLKAFGGNVAVQNVSMAFAEGRLHSILGPNGAGKTTLFNLLTKDLTPDTGTVRLEGADVTGLKPHQIARRGLSRSYQISSVYLDMTARENVWVASYRALAGGALVFWRRADRDAAVRDHADTYLRRLGLMSFADVPTKELSYGDQRLLEIAVTLASEPRIILLDEPTAGLSRQETEKVKRVIAALKGEFTIVMIEHNMGVVMEISDEISVMNRGAVIAHGSPAEIQGNKTVQEAYFGG